MTIRHLPRVVPIGGPKPDPIPDLHPMRIVTREMAFQEDRWTADTAGNVNALFDQLAGEWHTRARPERFAVISDALERGGPFAEGLAVELGSGTGIATPTIATRLPDLVAVDLSMEMLRLAPQIVPRIRADAAQLPFADGRVATLVLVNMLLFPTEAARVLDPRGALVWVNTMGPDTPIYLSAEDVDAALPGNWELVASEAVRGTWCVGRRAA